MIVKKNGKTEDHLGKDGIPSVVIEADMSDARVYSDGPIQTRIEAFMETLQNRQAQR